MSDSIQALTATLSQPRDQEKLERRPTGLTLEVVSGDLEGARYSLPNRSVLTGGRAASHDIVIDDESVSTTHFEIKLGAHGIVLRDLGSTNGTWIGRSRLLDGAVSLFDGATFYAGNIKLRLTQIDVGSVARSTAPTLGTMTGKSPVMAELFALMARLGPTPITALITGETGTGKEEAARTLHALSGRQGPFVVLDCGSLPTGLAESAISGHAKGAFTGAASDSPGAFEKGQEGTLFIDELGELPLDLQPKLLRVLDRREVQRIGTSDPMTVDVRVVAATNRNLAAMVAEGQFRVDLYHRIRQIELALPPLREREEDIPLLAERFLADFRATYDRRIELDDSAVELLRGLYWEGNVRQLRQTIERLAFLVEGETIRAEHLRAFGDDQVAGMAATLSQHAKRWLSLPFRQATDEFQKVYFEALLQATGGDLDEIARRSGYTRKGLQGVGRRLDLPLGGADRG